MAKTDQTPATKEITIQGILFDVTQPYAEGHVVTEAEAAALNQTRSENVRNNMARLVKAKQAELPEAVEGEPAPELSEAVLKELAEAVAEYDADYIFTLASVGGGKASRDPVDIEANRMARAAIVAQLKASGKKVGDVDADKLKAAIAKVAGTDKMREAAKKAVEERVEASKAALEGLDL